MKTFETLQFLLMYELNQEKLEQSINDEKVWNYWNEPQGKPLTKQELGQAHLFLLKRARRSDFLSGTSQLESRVHNLSVIPRKKVYGEPDTKYRNSKNYFDRLIRRGSRLQCLNLLVLARTQNALENGGTPIELPDFFYEAYKPTTPTTSLNEHS